MKSTTHKSFKSLSHIHRKYYKLHTKLPSTCLRDIIIITSSIIIKLTPKRKGYIKN